MDRIAKGFSDDEIAAIAAWYGRAEVMSGAIDRSSCGESIGERLSCGASAWRRVAAVAVCLRRWRRRSAPRVVVIGGGFAGATCARVLRTRSTRAST